MKRKLLFGVMFLMAFFTACSEKGPIWQERYDLGLHYMDEKSYLEAAFAFTAATELDADRPEAYLKAAEAYEGIGDAEAAKAILEKGYAATGDESLNPQKMIEDESDSEEVDDDREWIIIPPEDPNKSKIVSNNGKKVTLSLEVPELQDKYWVDKADSRDNRGEYTWALNFTDGKNTYMVETFYYKHPGAIPKEITLYQMDSHVLSIEKSTEGSIGRPICSAELQIVDNVLYWTFSIPPKYDFDAENIQITSSFIL